MHCVLVVVARSLSVVVGHDVRRALPYCFVKLKVVGRAGL